MQNEESNNIIIGGDLNLILHSNEKRGGSFGEDPFRRILDDIIQEQELVDIIPKNHRYTWSNRRIVKDNIMERLDRILISVSLLSSFSTASTNVLTFSASDHYPTTLSLATQFPHGPLPFFYSPLWNDIQEANQIVWKAWITHIEGSPIHIWDSKLKRTKQALKEWEKIHYQEPDKIKAEVKAKLKNVHRIIDSQGTSQDILTQEKDLYWQLHNMNRKEEEKWRLKSRNLWLQVGDKNTTFFHKQHTVRKAKNNISSITDETGTIQTDPKAIK